MAAAALRRVPASSRGRGRAPPSPWRASATSDVVSGTLRGKVEFEADEEGRELEVLDHLLRRSAAETFRARLGGLDLAGVRRRSSTRATGIETGDLVPASELLGQLGTVPGLAALLSRLGVDEVAGPGAGRRGRRVRARGPAPHPAAGQGRRPTAARSTAAGKRTEARSVGGGMSGLGGATRATATARGGAAPTRSPRRTTCARRSTRSASGCCGARACARRCATCCAAASPTAGRRAGLDDLRRARHASAARRARRGRLDGALDQVREQLDQALAAERERARRRPTATTPGFAETRLDTLPRSTPRRPSRSCRLPAGAAPEARADYRQILDLLRREVLDEQFARMKRGARRAARTPPRSRGGAGASRTCWPTSTRCWPGTRAARTRRRTSTQFMAQARRPLPRAARRTSTSSSTPWPGARRPRQRLMALADARSSARSWPGLMAQALGDIGLAPQMAAARPTRCARCGPTCPGAGGQRMRGDEPLGYGDATGALAGARRPRRRSRTSSGRSTPGATLDDVDVEAVERHARPRAPRRTCAALRELERELERQG